MEALALLLVLLFLAAPIMMIVVLVKLGGIEQQLSWLANAVKALRMEQGKGAAGTRAPVAEARQPAVAAGQPPEGNRQQLAAQQAAKPAEVHPAAAQRQEPQPVAKPVAPPVAAAKPAVQPAVAAKQEPAARPVPQAPARPVAPPPPPPPPLQPTAVDLFFQKVEDWIAVKGEFAPKGVTHEFALATHWLIRVGVVLVTASIVYFVKLSIDRGWMGPTGRVAATVFWGAVASMGGVFLVKRTRYGMIGHAVAALGVVALYFGFGLGHRFFDPPVIASPSLAFAALFGVTLYAGLASVFMPSASIAVMAVIGGYAVPVIAGRDTGSPTALCAYLLLIDAMAFFVARFRKWSALDFLSATIAYATMFVWCGMHPHLGTAQALTVFAFFTLVHAVYMVGVVVDSGKRGKAGNAMAWAGLVLNACTYLAYLVTHFRAGFSSELTGLVFLALVAAYIAVAAWGRRSGTLDRATVDIVLVFALAFLSIAPLLLFGSPWWTVSWCAIAVASSEAEARTGQRILGVLSLIVFAVAAFYGIFFLVPDAYGLAASGRGWGLGSAASGAAAYWSGLLLRSVRIWTIPVAAVLIGRRSRGWLYVAACVVGFLLYSLESWTFGKAYLPSLGGGIVTVAWFLLAFAGIWTGIVRRMRGLRIFSLSLLAVSVAKLLLIDTSHLATPARVALFALCGVLLIVGAFLYIKFRERFTENEEDNRK